MNVPAALPEPDEARRTREQVTELCRAVPQGRVTSYGALGAECDPPISGYICGRVMGQIMDGAPWWRVVGKDGKLPISKRSPNHSREQREKLEAEGVRFDDEGKIECYFFVGEAGEPSLFSEGAEG